MRFKINIKPKKIAVSHPSDASKLILISERKFHSQYSNHSNYLEWCSFYRLNPKAKRDKVIYKKWRSDINQWETKIKFICFYYYKYTTWKNGKTINKFSVFQKSSKTTRFNECKPMGLIPIGKEEFETKYKGNKWSVPVSHRLDLNLP
jgi:hypothetical protein